MIAYASEKEKTGKSILVVDDDPFSREMLRIFIEKRGHSTDLADDGTDALALLKSGRAYDLVISDINMPRMDGLTLLREIKKEAPGTRVILVTGGSVKPVTGADAVIAKPINFALLTRHVNTALCARQ
ncbi:MAG: response regulator [Chlamydiota bacterium]